MQKAILLICILLNFWGIYLTNALGLFSYTSFVFDPNAYYDETIRELFFISLFLVLICVFLFKNKKGLELYRPPVKYDVRNVALLKVLYFVFLVLLLSQISFDNSLRGVGQFDVSRRSGIKGLISSISPLAIAFLLFISYTKPFKRNYLYVLLLAFVMALSGLSHGGRRNIVYLTITLILFLRYVKNVKTIKYLPWLAIIVPLLFGFAILTRRGSISSLKEYSEREVMQYSTASIMQTNSDPSFLWGIKEYEDFGITMSPVDFLHHFTSILMPSFVYSKLTGKISSYDRSVFVFDYWFNNNENQGWDFMTLADFYWCFGKWGYLLYLFVFCFVLYYFKRFIRSNNVYLSASAILAILFFCQQRNDFGAILKPFVYTLIFLFILEKMFITSASVINEEETQ